MEKALLIAGRILAVFFGAVAAVVLTMLVVGTTLVNAVVTIPATAVQTLSEENFLAESGQIAVRVMFASLPETIEVNGLSIPRSELISSLAQSDIKTIAQHLIPREWLITQLDSAFDKAVANSAIVQDNRAIQFALRGVQGHEVARMLVEAARNCSESEIATLIKIVNPDLLDKPVVDFICNPPSRADVDLKAAMQGLIVTVLPLIADRLSERIPNPFEELQLPELAIDTPMGVLSVDGLTLHLSAGNLDFSYTLGSKTVETTDASAMGASTLVLASNLAQEVPTEEAPDAAVRPGIEATEAAEASSSEDSDARSVAKLRETVETLKLRLAELAVSINQILIGGFGVLLILLTIEVLFFVRTLRALGIWLGGVLLASGVLILLMHARFSSNGGIGTVYSAPDGALGQAVMEIRANLTDAISSAVQSQLGNPLQISGIVLALVGVAVLGGLLYSIRRAQT